MSQNQPPQRKQVKPASTASAPPQNSRPRRRKIIQLRYQRGDDDIWIRVSPKTAATIGGILLVLLGLPTANSILQSRSQHPALPPSQRIAEDSK